MTKNYLKKGFTLVELLVVIAIIGILASIVTVSFSSVQKQARDTNRKSDLAQYRSSLESYANRNGSLYPARNNAAGVVASTTLCTDLGLATCPEDPKNASDATFIYRYQSDGAVSNGTPIATAYVLWAKIEGTTNYWVVCSTGKSGTKAQAGFSVSGGVCPI